jgi:hypothetical protein
MSDDLHHVHLSFTHPAFTGDDSLDFLREAETALECGDTQKARERYRCARDMKSENALVLDARKAGLTRLLDAIEHGFDGLVDARKHSLPAAQRPKYTFAAQ